MRTLSVLVAIAVLLVAWRVSAQPPAAAGPVPLKTPGEVAPAPTLPAIEPPPDLSPFLGKPVTRVQIALESNPWDDVPVPEIQGVRAGEPLTQAVARRALDEALALGGFARGRVSAYAEGQGVKLLLRLVPRKLIETLRVNLHAAKIDRDDVLREVDLAEGGEIVGSDIGDLRHAIERLFARHGYPSAQADIETVATDVSERVLVILDVEPGPERLVDRRYFYVFGADPKDVESMTDDYAVKAHDRADETALVAADRALASELEAHGYHRAGVSHDLVAQGGQVAVRVRVDTGPRFEVRFEGNDNYDTEALSGTLALEEETDRSTSHLTDKLKAFYEKRGYLDVDVRPETRGSPTAKVLFLVFHITEGRRVRVASRSYPCLKVDEIKKLTGGGPRSASEIGSEIDSYLDEELPGADLVRQPNARGISQSLGAGAGQIQTGARPVPTDLDPDTTYVADTFGRAVEHVKELYRNEGYLHAEVGPVQVVRARCNPRSPPGECVPVPLPPPPTNQCTYDATNLPLPVPPLDASYTCKPDPAKGIECAPSLEAVIPVKLGPRTRIYDLAFTGVHSLTEADLAKAAALDLGEPVSTLKIEDAQRKISDLYKEEGFAYVDVRYTIEASLDHTRARVRYDVNEGTQVIVRDIVIKGNDQTHTSVIRRRVALEIGQPYRTSLVRKTQERIATLGTFASVNVALEEPYVVEKYKAVDITVTERLPQLLELSGGFSTGEGVRGDFNYTHRNLFGTAISVVLHVHASYLPDAFILDPQVKTNFDTLSGGDRLARRSTLSFIFPEIGLGPLVRQQTDFVDLLDLERDFYLSKDSVFGNVIWQPARQVRVSGGQTAEYNVVRIFNGEAPDAYLASVGANSDLQRLLRLPAGKSIAFAQRFLIAWDRRDDSFNPHTGTYSLTGAELVNSYPVNDPTGSEGHFVRFTQTIGGYIPVANDVTFASELRVGQNVQLTSTSKTYPDRLFFMGGADSMRGWLLDTFVPQEYVTLIQQSAKRPECAPSTANAVVPIGRGNVVHNENIGTPNVPASCFTINDVGLRGGNLMVNPSFELRFPLKPPLYSAVFADLGNLWIDSSNLYDQFAIRADVGTGLRLKTPVAQLRLDLGYNVTQKDWEDPFAVSFAVGIF